MRAFVRSTPPVEGVNDTVLGDTSQPVSAEEISALGWKLFTFGTDAQGQEKFNAMAKSQGYPEHDALNLDFSRIDEVQQLKEISDKLIFSNTISPKEPFFLALSGSWFTDIEDTINNRWIRLVVTAGDGVLIPSGALYQCAVSEADLKQISVLLRLKVDELSVHTFNDHYISGKDAEKHPSRATYSKSLGQ
uniref:Uncharacterized protein n=1 Tax=Moniliophthora roreri TaxID=221103 RepID=A0A0W0FVY6_MONRR